MIQTVEKSTDIYIQDPADIDPVALFPYLLQGLVRVSPRSEAVGEVIEVLLIHRS
jgi:hypothetical protein